MRLKWRMKISKVKWLHHMVRVLMYNSGWIYYRKRYVNGVYKKIFQELKGLGSGKRCFIIGNGPSLNLKDLDKLKNEDCFSSNGIFRLVSQTTWRPKYYMIMDRYTEITSELIKSIGAKYVFLGDYFLRFNDIKFDNAICLHEHYPYLSSRMGFSKDISKGIFIAPTVSYGLMQVAVYMGYKEIYLLGFDHNYGFEIVENGGVIKTNVSAHFYQDEIPEKIIADIQGMTQAYKVFRDYAKEHGIVVKNVTRGGKLEVFERQDFDSLFEKDEVKK